MKEFLTPGAALAYIANCQLATIDDMALKKRKPVHEYARQKSIAETCVAAALRFSNVGDIAKTRILAVNAVGSVEAYAKAIEDRA
jgi:hypothetical protein